MDIRNWNSSPFGSGWEPTWLDWLVPNAQGVSFVSGDGTMSFFTSDGSGGYQSEPGPLAFSTLTGNWTSGFTLTGTDGTEELFDNQGRLTKSIDHDGNATTYAYNAYGITSVTDPDDHTTTYGYTGDLVTTVTDFASHVTTLGYTGDQLTSITQPDPGGGLRSRSLISHTQRGCSIR